MFVSCLRHEVLPGDTEEWRDSKDRLHKRIVDGRTETYTYDKAGNAIHYNTSDGYEWWATYDEHGNMVTYKDSLGNIGTYDDEGNFNITAPDGSSATQEGTMISYEDDHPEELEEDYKEIEDDPDAELTLDDVAWYYNNSDNRTHEVMTKKPNEIDLYDMSGNVYEWCDDYFKIVYDPEAGEQKESTIIEKDPRRVIRGGGFGDAEDYTCRVSYRSCYEPTERSPSIGFRLALDADSSRIIEKEGFVRVSGACFTMGGYDEEEHEEYPRDFYILPHEVTQGEYKAIMGENPSHFNLGDNYPVENVSWYDVIRYCNMLSIKEGLKPSYGWYDRDIEKWTYPVLGTEIPDTVTVDRILYNNGYRLPDEIEWEFAARGGKASSGYCYSGAN